MVTESPNLCQSGVVLGLIILSVWGIVRGYQVWKNPDNAKSLGLGWYTSMIRWITPMKDKDKVDGMMSSPAVVRFFAVSTLLGGVIFIIVLAIGLVVLLTQR